MKKLLTVSLFAVMAVSAAHAQIASTEYVGKQINAFNTDTGAPLDAKVGDIQFKKGVAVGKTNVTAAIDAVADVVAGLSSGDGSVASQIAVAKGQLEEYAQGQASAAQQAAEKTASDNLALHAQTASETYETKIDAGNKLTEAKNYTDAAAKAGTDGKLGSGFVKTYVDDKVGDLGDNATVVAYVGEQVKNINDTMEGQGGDIQQLDADLDAEIARAEAAEEAIVKIEDGKVTGGLISEMDLTQTGGQYVKYVEQEDGKVTAEGASFAEALSDAETNAPQAKVVKAYTDTAIKNLTALDKVPQECKGDGVRCALIAVGGDLQWEVVEY